MPCGDRLKAARAAAHCPLKRMAGRGRAVRQRPLLSGVLVTPVRMPGASGTEIDKKAALHGAHTKGKRAGKVAWKPQQPLP